MPRIRGGDFGPGTISNNSALELFDKFRFVYDNLLLNDKTPDRVHKIQRLVSDIQDILTLGANNTQLNQLYQRDVQHYTSQANLISSAMRSIYDLRYFPRNQCGDLDMESANINNFLTPSSTSRLMSDRLQFVTFKEEMLNATKLTELLRQFLRAYTYLLTQVVTPNPQERINQIDELVDAFEDYLKTNMPSKFEAFYKTNYQNVPVQFDYNIKNELCRRDVTNMNMGSMTVGQSQGTFSSQLNTASSSMLYGGLRKHKHGKHTHGKNTHGKRHTARKMHRKTTRRLRRYKTRTLRRR